MTQRLPGAGLWARDGRAPGFPFVRCGHFAARLRTLCGRLIQL